MLASPVARVYAEAMFGIAKDRGAVEETGAELQGFLRLVRDNTDVERFLRTPVLEPSVKVKHLRKSLDGNISAGVSDFLCLLVKKGRSSSLGKIVDAFQQLADEHANRARVSVRTATPLSDRRRGEIEEVLRASLAKEVVIEQRVEPAIMGGAVVAIGDRVYDGSIRKRLSAFRKQIMRSGGYEAQG